MKNDLSIPVQITEIFHSIQGESSHAGKPSAFVRLTGCSLRCVYCDTKYSYSGGHAMAIGEVLETVSQYPTRLVEITGGEPLEQEGAIPLWNNCSGEATLSCSRQVDTSGSTGSRKR